MYAMKQVLVSLVLLASVTYVRSGEYDRPVFIKTLEKLQRGPPHENIMPRANVETSWIQQKLDQFNDTNTETFKMRYLINDEFQSEGGPIFIYIGGEWEIEPSMISIGIWYDLAREHKGLLIYSEHRYYGQSVPTDNLSTESLQYLHVKQAVADLAHLIRTLKSTTAGLENSKVLLAGGSYSATMVVWFKRLYPELVAGGFASSAPLLAKVDFREYKEVVGRAFRELGSQQCYDHIEAGIADLESMFANKRSAEARTMLRLCNRFDENNDLDLWTLFSSISNIFSGIAQYQRDDNIPNICNQLLSWADPAVAIANFAYQTWGSPLCADATYKDTLEWYDHCIDNVDDSRSWYYQTCNEYGWYQSSASRNQPFGRNFPALLYTTLCSDIFGIHYTNEQINKNVEQTNEEFGGMAPDVENIYLTHGALDPWHPLGHGVAEGATIIANASHCNDFRSINVNDSSDMRASKERLWELVAQWLA